MANSKLYHWLAGRSLDLSRACGAGEFDSGAVLGARLDEWLAEQANECRDAHAWPCAESRAVTQASAR